MRGDSVSSGRKLTLGEKTRLEGVVDFIDLDDLLLVKKVSVSGKRGVVRMTLKVKSDGREFVIVV
jgi:hypothetical protein